MIDSNGYKIQVCFDNIIFSLQKAGGISVYWAELIKRASNKYYAIFFEKPNANIFRNEIYIDTKLESNIFVGVLRYLPFLRRLPDNTIFHSSYYRVSLQRNVINITTVHDFTYEYFRKGLSSKIHHFQKFFAIKMSDGIVCVSNNTKNDLIKFFPFVNKNKIRVIYNGVSDDFHPLSDVKSLLSAEFNELLGKRFVVFVGDRINYKNFSLVIEALNGLDDFSLVIVGGKPLSQEENILMKLVKNRVYHYQGISSVSLNILYSASHCLVYPSSYEGFGIPVIEAMKSGCPVVTTNYSSIPEVAGDAGVYIENLSVDDLRKAILSLSNSKKREEVVSLGLIQASKFSWSKCADETFSFYKEIYDRKIGKDLFI